MTTKTTKWIMLALSYTVLIACFIPYIGWSLALADIQAQYELSSAQVGALGSYTALAGGIVLPFAGYIGDRIGVKKVILLGLVLSIIGQFLFAWAPDYTMILLSRIISGAGVGLLFVGPYTMAASWFEREKKQGVALGVMFTSDGIGSAFALFIFTMVIVALGWQQASAVGGYFLIAVLIVAALFLKDAPKELSEDLQTTGVPVGGNSLFKWLKHRNVITATLFFIGEWGIFAVVAVWMPTILVEGAGWDATVAGFFASLYVLGGIVTSIGFGLVSDRMGRRRGLIILAGAVMVIAMAGLTFSVATGNYTLAVVLMPIVGLGVYTGMPLALALATQSVPTTMIASTTGTIMGIGFIVGGVVYPWFIGLVKDTTGEFTVGFTAMTIATVVLNLGGALISRDIKPVTAK